MISETRQCQNCKKEFIIEPEDFEFYEKIKVPPPTWCPECRMIRRMMWRNERSLYRRKCDLCGDNIIAIHPQNVPYRVYCPKCWWSDNWDPMDYSRNYDFSRPFFEQFKELMEEVPLPSIQITNSKNSDYTHISNANKNCYLIFSSGNNEECYYGNHIHSAANCIDIYNSFKIELCYQCIDVQNAYKCVYCINTKNSQSCSFCINCKNCEHCFGCFDLRNKKYHIFNKAFTKDEYFKEIQKYHYFFERGFDVFNESDFCNLKNRLPVIYCHNISTRNSVGDYLNYCFNTLQAFNCDYCEDSKYVFGCIRVKDCFDSSYVKYEASYFYDTLSAISGNNMMFNYICWWSYNSQYSAHCVHSNDIFGCIGLRHKQYCILNKQYTKEEYERLVPKIIEHMNSMPYIDKKGRIYKYGEFFPPEISPFCYNETIAQEYFPLTEEQALAQGYRWKKPEERDYKIDIKTEDLPDHIKDVKDDIIGKIIQCAHAKLGGGRASASCNEQCTTAFKIIPQELEFYRKMNLPLPRLCPNCRHYQRIKQRNPLKLWKRKCMCGGQTSVNGVYKNTIKHFHGDEPCPNEFQTTYAPDRPEIIYCEKCYLAEVV